MPIVRDKGGYGVEEGKAVGWVVKGNQSVCCLVPIVRDKGGHGVEEGKAVGWVVKGNQSVCCLVPIVRDKGGRVWSKRGEGSGVRGMRCVCWQGVVGK